MLKSNYNKKQLKKSLDVFEKHNKERPKPERNLDQFRATNKTVLKRAMILGKTKKISSKKFLFLGDNDLTSVIFSLFFKAKKVTVVDIDKRILKLIKKISKKEDLSINLFQHNLRNPLPKRNFRDYDIIFCDPPYTPLATNTWLKRAVEASLSKGDIKKRKKTTTLLFKKYFLCYGYTEKSLIRGFEIQRIITNLGLVIQEKIRNFNHYYRASSINSASDLYLIKPTPKVNIKRMTIRRHEFYTGQKSNKNNK